MKAPYFSTIKPQFKTLRPGYCEVSMKKRRAVLNHLGSVHAIAELNPVPEFSESVDLPVTVNLLDASDRTVFRAVITMKVSPKKK